MKKKLKKLPAGHVVSHHRHTGHLLPRQHTSYAMLTFILLITGVLLLSLTITVYAASVTVNGRVPGTPPSEPATILQPVNNQRFDEIPIEVSGTCPSGYIVKLYGNNLYRGSTMCEPDDTFKITADLFPGANELQAKVYNLGENEGPPSPAVTVFYDQPTQPSANDGASAGEPDSVSPGQTSDGGAPGTVPVLLIKTDLEFRGYKPGEEVKWTIELMGGTNPYALSVDWGDGKTDLLSLVDAGSLTLKHKYKKPGKYRGSYIARAKITDKVGRTTFVQAVFIVNDPGAIGAGSTSDDQLKDFVHTFRSRLIISWPFYIMALLMVVSFWLGERRGIYLLQKRLRRRHNWRAQH